MIGAAVTVWAIGVAIYEFIYGYFASTHLKRAKAIAKHPTLGSCQERTGMRRRLLQNYWVFSGYLVAGGLTTISLYVSGITLANEDPGTLGIAYAFFGAVIVWHLGLFSFEFFTSMRQVGGLADEIEDPQPESAGPTSFSSPGSMRRKDEPVNSLARNFGTRFASRRFIYALLVTILAVSYASGYLVYLGAPKQTSAAGLMQFFSTATAVTASFLVTDGIALASIYKEISTRARPRWFWFFSVLLVALFGGVLVSGIWMFTYAATFPSVPFAADVGVVIVFGSWFVGIYALVLELALLIPRD